LPTNTAIQVSMKKHFSKMSLHLMPKNLYFFLTA
jgi:hypothetical protein